MTISRKRSADSYKSLIDIRAKDVLEKVSSADHIEVEFCKDTIVAHIYKKLSAQIQHLCKTIDISEVMEETETIAIDRSVLSTGTDDFVQLSFIEGTDTYYKRFTPEIETVFKIVSLFSGAGMLDYPFAKDSRYKILLANDIGEGQVKSYRKNIGEMIVKKDIRELSIIPTADVVLGGPSCKPFSNCNRQKARLKDHPDYFLIKDYIRIVKQANPKVFVIENVPEFITTAEGMILEDIMLNLNDYTFTVKKVIDCDVGGYTTRKRILVIGSRIGEISLSDITLNKQNTVKDALDKVDASWFNFNDFSSCREETRERMAYVRDGNNWQDVPEAMRKSSKFANYLRRLDPNAPAPAIVNVRKSIIMPPKQYITTERTLSVAECSALMGFPKEFVYMGTLDERQQQVANGVPFAIAKLVKTAVTKALLAFQNKLKTPPFQNDNCFA